MITVHDLMLLDSLELYFMLLYLSDDIIMSYQSQHCRLSVGDDLHYRCTSCHLLCHQYKGWISLQSKEKLSLPYSSVPFLPYLTGIQNCCTLSWVLKLSFSWLFTASVTMVVFIYSDWSVAVYKESSSSQRQFFQSYVNWPIREWEIFLPFVVLEIGV